MQFERVTVHNRFNPSDDMRQLLALCLSNSLPSLSGSTDNIWSSATSNARSSPDALVEPGQCPFEESLKSAKFSCDDLDSMVFTPPKLNLLHLLGESLAYKMVALANRRNLPARDLFNHCASRYSSTGGTS